MTMELLGLVLLGGAIGAMSRLAITTAQTRWTRWPAWTGTLAANLLGCLLVGLAAGLASDTHWIHALAVTGFCGAMTTFSSFALDMAMMVLVRAWAQLTACILLSVAGGVPLVWAGLQLAASMGAPQ